MSTPASEHGAGDAGSKRELVVLTGAAVACALGSTLDAFNAALDEGRGGISRVRRFSTEGLHSHYAATIDDPAWEARFAPDADLRARDPFDVLCVNVATRAFERSGLRTSAGFDARRVAVFVGTTAGGLHSRERFERTSVRDEERWWRLVRRGSFHRAAGYVCDALGLAGPRATFSTACTSSAHAVAHARAMLDAGAIDAALVGGADVLVEALYGGFYALGAMSPGPCAPFSEPAGMTLGEGAGFVVLERASQARARGARFSCALVGAATSMDAHHATAADPTGSGVARAVTLALADAGLAPSAVGYVNAHGTGTDVNDAAELRGLRRALGPRCDAVPVSSSKSFFGHTLGAAGVLELLATCWALDARRVPPTLQFTRPRAGAPRDPVGEARARPHEARVALSLNAAFGGINAALLVARADGAAAPAPRPRAPVYLRGAEVLAACAPGAFDEALRAGVALATPLAPRSDGAPSPTRLARLVETPVEAHAPGVDPRGLDRASSAALVAVARSLAAARAMPRGAQRDRVGLYYVCDAISPDTGRDFWDSIAARGAARLNATAFARAVANAPAGAVSRALSLRGPCGVLVGRSGATLAALALAADELATRDDAAHLALCAVGLWGDDDLVEHGLRYRGDAAAGLDDPLGADGCEGFPGDAVTALLLSRERPASGPAVRVASVAWRGVAALGEAIDEALARAGVAPSALGAAFVSGHGRGPAALDEHRALRTRLREGCPVVRVDRVFGRTKQPDALALAAAYEALRRGRPQRGAGALAGPLRSALVVAEGQSAGALAVLLIAED